MPPGFRLEFLLMASGIGNLLVSRMDSFLDILDDIHRRGMNLLGLALDLMAYVTGEFPISGFKLAFGIFGCSITFIRHDSRKMEWIVGSVAGRSVTCSPTYLSMNALGEFCIVNLTTLRRSVVAFTVAQACVDAPRLEL